MLLAGLSSAKYTTSTVIELLSTFGLSSCHFNSITSSLIALTARFFARFTLFPNLYPRSYPYLRHFFPPSLLSRYLLVLYGGGTPMVWRLLIQYLQGGFLGQEVAKVRN